jgi:hypothetical protein
VRAGVAQQGRAGARRKTGTRVAGSSPAPRPHELRGGALDETACPQPGCAERATVLKRYVMGSTAGPVECWKIRCPDGHFFQCPISAVADDR